MEEPADFIDVNNLDIVKKFYYGIDSKTDLNINEIKTLSLLELYIAIIKQEFKTDTGLETLIEKYKRYKISLDRKGRREFFKILETQKTEEAENLADKIKKLFS
jgi:hypothetical protein